MGAPMRSGKRNRSKTVTEQANRDHGARMPIAHQKLDSIPGLPGVRRRRPERPTEMPGGPGTAGGRTVGLSTEPLRCPS